VTTMASTPPAQDELVDGVLAASRALVAIAVRSLAGAADDITLVQYRALVVLAYNGAQRTIDLANELGVNSSTVTRLVDRLERKGLAQRSTSGEDRRATLIDITRDGRAIVAAVTTRRRAEVSRILRKIGTDDRRRLLESLEVFRQAAGEAPEQSWSLGWAR
jgi:DNA-binding MarR family transcriptional regulator